MLDTKEKLAKFEKVIEDLFEAFEHGDIHTSEKIAIVDAIIEVQRQVRRLRYELSHGV